MMKTLRFSLMTLGLVLAVGCSNTRITTASEYDSVYFTSKDKIGATYAQNDDDNNQRNTQEERDDDFQYSRRLRRFSGNAAVSNWRYYDPYFSNDLYYVMGTPYWSTWNNNGWYNCNSPYLGSPYGYSGYGNSYYNWGGGSYSPYYSMGYYNPWMSNYYGYNAYNLGGYYGYNPYGGYAGYYGGGYNNGYYHNYYNNSGYNAPNNVWHHGSTNTFVGSTAATNGGTVRPTPVVIAHGVKNTASPQNGSNNPMNGNVGETAQPVKYLKPRSNQDFNNLPPKTYTNTEMYNGGAIKNSTNSGSVKNPTMPSYNNNSGAIKGGNTPTYNNTPAPIRNNTPTPAPIKNNQPAPIRNNTPSVRPQTSPSPSPSFHNNNSGGGGFSRPSGGSSSGGGGAVRHK